MKRALLVVMLALVGMSFAHGGARISFCETMSVHEVFSWNPLCSISAYNEWGDTVGFFVQTTPRLGAFYDNFQIVLYKPRLMFNLFGIQMEAQPGLAWGMSEGVGFIGFSSDILIAWP